MFLRNFMFTYFNQPSVVLVKLATTAIIFIEKLATSKVNLRVDLRMVNETYFQRARVHDNIILIEKEELAAIK